jgi:hypothetical protein
MWTKMKVRYAQGSSKGMVDTDSLLLLLGFCLLFSLSLGLVSLGF